MAVMERGATVELTREVPGLRSVVLGVAWKTSEPALDENLVVAALLCDAGGKATGDGDAVFFNQLSSAGGSVSQLESGLGGDSEQVEIDLDAVPPAVERVVVVAYVNEGTAARRSLGQLRALTIRVLNLDGDVELVRSADLAPPLTDELAIVLGALYRRAGGWRFRVRGDAYPGLRELAADYGLPL